MFENLTKKISNIFDKIKGSGVIDDSSLQNVMREIRIALLESDVSLSVAKDFIENVKSKAIGQEVIKSISPDQMIIKIVNDQLTELLGSENDSLKLNAKTPVLFLMVGLQGSGKTTTLYSYTLGHCCRFVGALSSKYNDWRIPITLLLISMIATIPVVVDDTSKLGFLGLAVGRCADMLPHHYAELGVIVRGSEGTKLVKERRSQYGTACLTAAWVLGYSSASVISGFLYQYIGFDPIGYSQLIGLIAHVVFRVMYCSSSNSRSHVVVVEKSKQKEEPKKPKRLSFPTITWSYVFLGIFYHSAPVVIWISFANLYQTRFGVGTAVSCVVQMAGDFIGSAWVMYKGHLRSSSNNHVTTRGPIQRWIISARKLWCFI